MFLTIFLAILGNFEQLLFFYIFDKKMLFAPKIYYFSGGGGTPKFILTIFHLVIPILMCKQNFRHLQPFLLGNLVE